MSPCRLVPSGSQQNSKVKENKAFKESNSETISLHAFVWMCIFCQRFDFRTGGSKLVEFKVVGTETWGSTAPISSQEGFGIVHAPKMWPCSPQLMQKPVLILCWNSAWDNLCLAFIRESFFFCTWGGSFRFCPSEEVPCPWPSLPKAPTEDLLDLSKRSERPPSEYFCFF